MSEFQAISTVVELDNLDSSECVDGYLSGLNGDPEPGNDKSKSYWHG